MRAPFFANETLHVKRGRTWCNKIANGTTRTWGEIDEILDRDAAKCENCVAAVMRVDVCLCLLLSHITRHKGMSINHLLLRI